MQRFVDIQCILGREEGAQSVLASVEEWPPTADLMKTIGEMITSSPPSSLVALGIAVTWK